MNLLILNSLRFFLLFTLPENLLITVENYLKEILKFYLRESKTHSLIDCFNTTKLVSGFFTVLF